MYSSRHHDMVKSNVFSVDSQLGVECWVPRVRIFLEKLHANYKLIIIFIDIN